MNKFIIFSHCKGKMSYRLKVILDTSIPFDKKQEVIVLTKTDLVTPEVLEEKMELLKAKNSEIIPVSIFDEDSIKNLKAYISRQIQG